MEDAFSDLKAAQSRLANADTLVAQAEEALALAKSRYANGVITNFELLDAQSRARDAELTRLQARYDCVLAGQEIARGRTAGRAPRPRRWPDLAASSFPLHRPSYGLSQSGPFNGMYTIIGGDGREYGPVPADQIRAWIAAGRASLETQAKRSGTDEWKRLGDIPEFTGGEEEPPPVSGAGAVPAPERAMPTPSPPR